MFSWQEVESAFTFAPAPCLRLSALVFLRITPGLSAEFYCETMEIEGDGAF